MIDLFAMVYMDIGAGFCCEPSHPGGQDLCGYFFGKFANDTQGATHPLPRHDLHTSSPRTLHTGHLECDCNSDTTLVPIQNRHTVCPPPRQVVHGDPHVRTSSKSQSSWFSQSSHCIWSRMRAVSGSNSSGTLLSSVTWYISTSGSNSQRSMQSSSL